MGPDLSYQGSIAPIVPADPKAVGWGQRSALWALSSSSAPAWKHLLFKTWLCAEGRCIVVTGKGQTVGTNLEANYCLT